MLFAIVKLNKFNYRKSVEYCFFVFLFFCFFDLLFDFIFTVPWKNLIVYVIPFRCSGYQSVNSC